MNEKPEIYMHEFESKDDIIKEFDIDKSSLDGCHVYLAYYHVGSYGCDSSAFVLYEDSDGNLKEVNGCHCSCHELEGQWEPEETTVEALEHRLEHGSLGGVGGYDNDGYAEQSRIVVDYLLARRNLQSLE